MRTTSGTVRMVVAPGPAGSLDVDGDLARAERRADGVAVVTLSRPKTNALSLAMLVRLRAVVAELAADPPGAVVVWGGPRVFSSGAEVGELTGPEAASAVTAAFHAVTADLAGLARVTVAAICGYALGGGLELALACDLRVVADDARLGQPEIRLGIIPGGGATKRLARLIGPARAKDLVLTGRAVGADEALRIGLADRVVARAAVFDEATALAAEMASGPLAAQALAKQVIDAGADEPLSRALEREASAFREVFETEDARVGIASFLEHGPGRARFTGR